MAKTMAWEILGDTMVLAHNDLTPADDEWDAFVKASLDVKGVIVSTTKGAPTSVQRNKARQAWGSNPPRLAVLSDSTFVKGVLSVFSLFLGGLIKGFSPTQEDAACDHVQVPESSRAEVKAALARVKAHVAAALTLAGA